MTDPQPEATALARELAGVRAKLLAEQQAHEQTRRDVAELREAMTKALNDSCGCLGGMQLP